MGGGRGGYERKTVAGGKRVILSRGREEYNESVKVCVFCT